MLGDKECCSDCGGESVFEIDVDDVNFVKREMMWLKFVILNFVLLIYLGLVLCGKEDFKKLKFGIVCGWWKFRLRERNIYLIWVRIGKVVVGLKNGVLFCGVVVIDDEFDVFEFLL